LSSSQQKVVAENINKKTKKVWTWIDIHRKTL
jgi:hypothetical protein